MVSQRNIPLATKVVLCSAYFLLFWYNLKNLKTESVLGQYLLTKVIPTLNSWTWHTLTLYAMQIKDLRFEIRIFLLTLEQAQWKHFRCELTDVEGLRKYGNELIRSVSAVSRNFWRPYIVVSIIHRLWSVLKNSVLCTSVLVANHFKFLRSRLAHVCSCMHLLHFLYEHLFSPAEGSPLLYILR